MSEMKIELSSFEIALIINAVTSGMHHHLQERDEAIETNDGRYTSEAGMHNNKRIFHKQILDKLATRASAATYILTLPEEEDNG